MYLITIFIASIYFFLFVNNNTIKWISVSGILLTAIAWRFGSWMHPNSLCIDEAEWLALAGRAGDCGIPYRCYNGGTSGFLTVGFVSLIELLGLKLSYFNLRIFGFIGCIIPTIIFTFLGLKKWYGQNIAVIVFPWLAMFMIFGFYNREFLSYNTEYILMFLFSVTFYFYACWKERNFDRMHEPILMAVILGILPYFKLQAVPFVFAFYTIIIWQFWTSRNWIRLAVWNLILALPTIIFFSYFIFHNVFDDFYLMYINFNMFYVDQPVVSYRYSDNDFVHRLRAFKGMHITAFLPFYIGLIPVVLINIKHIISVRFAILSKIVIWIFILGCYGTYAPGTGFGHYNLLLIVPIIFVLGSFYQNLEADKMRINRWLTLIGVSITSMIYCKQAEFYDVVSGHSCSDTEKYIVKQTTPKEQVLFLGYSKSLEAIVCTGRKMPVRNASAYCISIKDSVLRAYFQARFFEDMGNSKPRFVVDMEEVLDRPALMPVKNYLNAHYWPDTSIEGNMIYRIKTKNQ
ncbi:MAG: hypothetical protein ACK5CL_01015 [Sphingomonadales bacterium]|jgi:hypothetical protein